MFYGVRLRYKSSAKEKILVFTSWYAADFYIIMIPAMMVAGNPEVDDVKSACIIPLLWAGAEV